MSLFFNADTEKVIHAAAATINSLDTTTMLIWYRASTIAGGTGYMGAEKDTGSAGWIFFRPLGGTGPNDWRFFKRRATTNTDLESSGGIVQANRWECIVATDSDGVAPNLYHAAFGSTLTETSYASRTTGSGGSNDDSGIDIRVASQAIDDSTFNGDIAVFAIWNTKLTLTEIRQQQYSLLPRVQVANCVLFTVYGFNGTGTQPDWSGNGNSGVVTGATVSDNVPLPPLVYQQPIFVVAGTATNTKTHVLDAVLVKTNTASHIIDAVLQSQGNTASFTMDAVLVKTTPATTTLDATLEAQGTTTSHVLDAVLKSEGNTQTVSLDAVLRKTNTTSHVLDSVLLKTSTATFVMQAVLDEAGTKTLTLDAVLEDQGVTVSNIIDAVLKAESESATATLDSILQGQANTTSFVMDAALSAAGAGQTTTHVLDAVLKSQANTATFVMDAALSGGVLTETINLEAEFDLSASLKAEFDLSESLQAELDTSITLSGQF